jgi:THO complex subunit 3
VTITVDNLCNRYFATGGSDSLIAIWDMQELMVKKIISNNDYKVITIDNSFDGQYIAGVFEDDINKRFSIEIYDVESGSTMFSLQTS